MLRCDWRFAYERDVAGAGVATAGEVVEVTSRGTAKLGAVTSSWYTESVRYRTTRPIFRAQPQRFPLSFEDLKGRACGAED